MRIRFVVKPIALIALLAAGVAVQAQDDKGADVFKGRLFAPNVILQHREALDLSREQYTAIRQLVVATQADIAEHEWDLQEAYQDILAALDESPAEKDRILSHVDAALLAENAVKKQQVGLLIEMRNLLTDEQVEQLKAMTNQ